jgi:NAD+ kinase
MRIGIYTNQEKDPGCRLSSHLAELICRQGGIPVIDEEYLGASFPEIKGVEYASHASADLIICLGGDGTFLSAVHLPGCQDIPITGLIWAVSVFSWKSSGN